MTWKVQSFVPGSHPREVHSIEEYADELEAMEAYHDRSNLIRVQGGAAELLNPAGERMASTMRQIGGGK